MKKIISYLIAVMMVFTMIPYAAFAESAVNEMTTPSYTKVNPVYEGIIDESDLNKDGEPASLFSAEKNYLATQDEATEFVKDCFLNKVDTFMLYYKFPMAEAEGEWFEALIDEIFTPVFDHTGVPNEGDYISYSYGGYSIPQTSFSVDGTYGYLELPVTVTHYTTYDQEEELTEAIDKLLDEIIEDGMTDYEKVKAIYDYMTESIVYDEEHLNNDEYKLQFTAYAALMDKTSVCQGYANLFYRLALECGIDTRIIEGEANGGPHAWNIVKLGNKYYCVDATWDATYTQAGYDYRYFLKPSFADHYTADQFLTDEFKAAYPMADSEYVPGTGEDEGEQGGSEGTDPEQPIECTHTATEILPAVDASCTETGLTEGVKCASCGEILTAQESVKALGHDLTKHVAKDPTCKTEGNIEYYTCGKCEKIFVDAECKKEIKKPDTVIVDSEAHIFKEVTDAPTCTEPGQKKLVCIGCGKTVVIKTLPAAGHNFGEWTEIENPTCIEEGIIERVCQTCGYTERVGLPVAAHESEIMKAKAATLEAAGMTEGEKCSNCGAILKEQESIPRIKAPVFKNLKFVYDGKQKKPTITIRDTTGKKMVSGTDFSIKFKNQQGKTVSKPIAVGQYTAIVTFKGNYSGSVKKTFTINPKATTLGKLTKPGKKQIKVTWQKRTAQVTGYEIQYSTTKNFTKKTRKTLKVKNFKTTSKTIKKLKPKKMYWVKIRTYKNVGKKTYYSAWSKAKNITTK